MKKLVFGSKGKRIVFDDFVDERDQDYSGIWAGMCKECAKKYMDVLVDDSCNRLDECGSGTCSVEGCNNEADYYVDFWIDDSFEIIDDDKVVEFDTYPDMASENYDDEVRWFSVPFFWAEKWIEKNCDGLSVSEFKNMYTWDDTDMMYLDAYAENVLIKNKIEAR